MEWTKQSTKYNIDISKKDFMIISDKDDEDDRDLKDQLWNLLEDKTKNNVEYNGHFGATIFIEIDEKDDSEDFKKQIEKMIWKYING